MGPSADDVPNKENGESLATSSPDPAVPSMESREITSTISAPVDNASACSGEQGQPNTRQGEHVKGDVLELTEAELGPLSQDLPAPPLPSTSPTSDTILSTKENAGDSLPSDSAPHHSLFTLDPSESVSSHSSPDISLATPDSDSAKPPASTAPSSTRTSLTDTQPSGSKAPPSILCSATLPRSASMTAVTFAPLPPTEPRRRASHMQLGVAARSRMLRARRMHFVDPDTGEPVQVVDAPMGDHPGAQYHIHYAYPGEDGEEAYVIRTRRPPGTPYAGAWQAGQPQAGNDEEGTPEEDALIALGKMVKGGAKSLWRKVSKSGPREEAGAGEGEKRPQLRRSASNPVGDKSGGGRSVQSTSSDETSSGQVEYTEPRHCYDNSETSTPPPKLKPSSDKTLPETPSPEAHATSRRKEEEVGRVWEEAVDDDIQRRFSTISKENERAKTKNTLIGRIASCTQIIVGGKMKTR